MITPRIQEREGGSGFFRFSSGSFRYCAPQAFPLHFTMEKNGGMNR
jgi:hypothetical protein